MLTKEQQNIIENSIWVVNTALKKQGLQKDSDLRQNAILYMCLCLARFNPDKNVKWETFAYKSVYLYIKRLNYKEVKRKSREVSLDTMYSVKASETWVDELEQLNEEEIAIAKLKAVCTPKERLIIDYKLRGYKITEIAKAMGCCVSTISEHMKEIKRKGKELLE